MKKASAICAIFLIAAHLTALPQNTQTTKTTHDIRDSYIPVRPYSQNLARASRTLPFRVPLVWRKLAKCESNGRLRAISPSGTYIGMYQIHKGWYKGAGIDPYTATAEQQWLLAQRIYHRQGAKAWPYCSKKAGLK